MAKWNWWKLTDPAKTTLKIQIIYKKRVPNLIASKKNNTMRNLIASKFYAGKSTCKTRTSKLQQDSACSFTFERVIHSNKLQVDFKAYTTIIVQPTIKTKLTKNQYSLIHSCAILMQFRKYTPRSNVGGKYHNWIGTYNLDSFPITYVTVASN